MIMVSAVNQPRTLVHLILTIIVLYVTYNLTTVNSQVQIEVPADDIDILPGRTARLNCTVSNASLYTVSWIRHRECLSYNDQPASTTSDTIDVTRSRSDDAIDLLIRNVRQEHDGTYECCIVEGIDECVQLQSQCSRGIYLEVYNPPSGPHPRCTSPDKRVIDNIPLIEGDILSFHCEAGCARPTPRLTWVIPDGVHYQQTVAETCTTWDQDELRNAVDVTVSRGLQGKTLTCNLRWTIAKQNKVFNWKCQVGPFEVSFNQTSTVTPRDPETTADTPTESTLTDNKTRESTTIMDNDNISHTPSVATKLQNPQNNNTMATELTQLNATSDPQPSTELLTRSATTGAQTRAQSSTEAMATKIMARNTTTDIHAEPSDLKLTLQIGLSTVSFILLLFITALMIKLRLNHKRHKKASAQPTDLWMNREQNRTFSLISDSSIDSGSQAFIILHPRCSPFPGGNKRHTMNLPPLTEEIVPGSDDQIALPNTDAHRPQRLIHTYLHEGRPSFVPSFSDNDFDMAEPSCMTSGYVSMEPRSRINDPNRATYIEILPNCEPQLYISMDSPYSNITVPNK